MIYGIGTDLVAVARIEAMFRRYGEACLFKFLGAGEHAECLAAREQPRFLAKRFVAKEALAKALGTGLRAPVRLTAIAVTHDVLGRPEYRYTPELTAWLRERGLTAYLSLSDERDYALAFAVVERHAVI